MKTDIISFSKELIGQLKSDNVFHETNDFNAAGKALSAIGLSLKKLRQFTVNYNFHSSDEEIQFFKELKPLLLSQYYYNEKKCAIHLYDSFHDNLKQEIKYNKILQKMHGYAVKHKSFYQYCVSGSRDHDRNFFTRGVVVMREGRLDERFSTGYDVILSKLLAHEMLKDFLIQRLAMQKAEVNKLPSGLSWTDSKVALIELIYALHVSGVINHNKGEIKQLVTTFQDLFDIDLGNYSRVFAEIRMRKNGQTTFLDRIKENLLSRMDEMDK